MPQADTDLELSDETARKPSGKIAVAAVIILVVVALVGRLGNRDESDDPAPIAISMTSTAVPMPTATLTDEELDARYPPLADVRELVVRPGESFGTRMQVSGEIMTIQVAPEGYIYKLGDQDTREFETSIYLNVTAPSDAIETVAVGYNGSTAGMFEDSRVLVYGTMVDTDSSGENAFGQEVTVPLIVADLVVKLSNSKRNGHLDETRRTFGKRDPS